MKSSVSRGSTGEPRRMSNVRLGLVLGGVAVALFLLALWKFRPL
jgi:hypothetical protein